MSIKAGTSPRPYPFPRTAPLDPPPELAEVRATDPVSTVELWDGTPALLATRYDDIRHILLDPQISSDTTRPGFPQASESAATFRSGQRALNRMDSPRHDVHRRMLASAFSVRHVREYRPYLDQLVGELCDAMEQSGVPADLVGAFALVVPARVITRILDLPPEDSELVGGFDTTANMIALGTLLFLQNPGQIEILRRSPELLPGAVEELLRYLSVAHHVAYRQAKGARKIDGRQVRDGDAVVAPPIAANHDPEAFKSPERFDITRDARAHVAFGYGIHQCLGQALARVELQAVFGKLFDRFPRLALATDQESLAFRNSIIYGVETLPVTW
jgi:cytochrome P450